MPDNLDLSDVDITNEPDTLEDKPKKKKSGGGIAGFAGGGLSFSQDVPWFERSEEQKLAKPASGFLGSAISGRTDRLPVSVAADSYVIPADVVSGLGQGNSLAGARILNEALKTGPWGTNIPSPKIDHSDLPKPPPAPSQNPAPIAPAGMAKGGNPAHMPIMVAGGEHIVPPHAVFRIGLLQLLKEKGEEMNKITDSKKLRDMSMTRGHRLLDDLVKRVRQHTVKKIKNLPNPKK